VRSCFWSRDIVTQRARSSASQQHELQQKQTGECGDDATEQIHDDEYRVVRFALTQVGRARSLMPSGNDVSAVRDSRTDVNRLVRPIRHHEHGTVRGKEQ
jgi:hypothetical protein